jgi:hypothetical protein
MPPPPNWVMMREVLKIKVFLMTFLLILLRVLTAPHHAAMVLLEDMVHGKKKKARGGRGALY